MNLTIAEKNDIVKGVIEQLLTNKKAGCHLRELINDVIDDRDFVTQRDVEMDVVDAIKNYLDDSEYVKVDDIDSVVEEKLSENDFVTREAIDEIIDDALDGLVIGRG